MSKNIILILARGGDLKKARLNLRIVNGKPLLYYILKSTIDSKLGDVFVSTDSEEIKEISKMYGGKIMPRPLSLTKNETPVEDIIKYSLNYLGEEKLQYEKCLVISPIYPLVKISTLKQFFKKLTKNKQTIFGIIEKKNEYVKKDSNDKIFQVKNKLFEKEKIVSFKIKSFLSKNHFQIPKYGIILQPEEVHVINNYQDLHSLEKILKRKKILVRVDADKKIGLGHVYNILAILNNLHDEEILIVMNKNKHLGDNKFKEHNYNIKYFKNEKELIKIIADFVPDIIFNDILDTSKEYMKKIKLKNSFIVNFEDLGEGNQYANLVFNPIYYSKKIRPNYFFGSEYACVRDEFRIWRKDRKINKKVSQILITFGGTDPSNITIQILKLISEQNFLKNINIVIILGIGYLRKKDVELIMHQMNQDGFSVKIVLKSDTMAKHISESDFVITSNGRTVFEIASLQVPMISISANIREEKHAFSKYSGGVLSLTYKNKLNKIKTIDSIKKMLDYKTRTKLTDALKEYDLLDGVQKIDSIIKNEYEKYKIIKNNQIIKKHHNNIFK